MAMTFKTTLAAVFLTTLFSGMTGMSGVSSLRAEEQDLFSSVRGVSVFDSATSDDAGVVKPSASARLTSIEVVAQLVREAGFDAKVLANQFVTTRKEQDPWAFPVLIEISADERHLIVVLGLSIVKQPSEVPASVWLRMLEANQKHPAAQFAFHPGRKRTEVIGLLPNTAIDSLTLRDEINRLAILARDTESAWKLPSEDDATASTSFDAVASMPTTSASGEPGAATSPDDNSASDIAVADRLVGRWSAATAQNAAFAAEFASTGRFVLVHVKQGQQTRSTGSFVIQSQQLIMTGDDGLRLTGAIQIVADSSFRFTPSASTTPLTFNRAN